MSSPAAATRKYAVFISYRHADNKELGRKWANWLHEALESYDVPPDLIGTTNLRGDAVPASLYPVFRDEEELPADADLSTNIRRALENSDLLVVLCSPRAVQSRFVAEEIRYFKELGKSDRVLALMIDGEPNASDDPAKRETFGPGAECFPEPLRFGVADEDNPKHIDWTARTEPIAADVRPGGRAVQGWTTAAAYQEQLNGDGRLSRHQITSTVREYAERLELAKLKVIAGAVGLPLGILTQRDQVQQLAKAKHRTKLLRRWLVAVGILTLAAITGGSLAWQQKQLLAVQLRETKRHLERSWLEEGRVWIQRSLAARSRGDNLSALMFAGRAIGYQGHGRRPVETPEFERLYPSLLGAPMDDAEAETARLAAAKESTDVIHHLRPTFLPLFMHQHKEAAHGVVFSPDGVRFACVSGKDTIHVWNAATGKIDAVLRGHSDWPTALAFSPDGRFLASGSNDKTVKLWDTFDGNIRITMRGHALPVLSLMFSPDGSCLATGSMDRTSRLWRVEDGMELETLRGHENSVTSVTFSPDGRLLASGSDDATVRIWDMVSKTETTALRGHADRVTSIAFSLDGSRLASGSFDQTIIFWDAANGTRIAQTEAFPEAVSCLVFAPDGRRLAAGFQEFSGRTGEIRFLNPVDGRVIECLGAHRSSVTSLAFSPDGSRLSSGSEDNILKLWDVSDDDCIVKMTGHMDAVRQVVFSPVGAFLASGSESGHIKLWDTASGKEVSGMRAHLGAITCMTFTADGTGLATGADDRTVKIWDMHTCKTRATFDLHTDRATCLAFSPDGNSLACGSTGNAVRRYDLTSGRELPSLQGHADGMLQVVFDPAGKLLASLSKDGTIRLWDVGSGKERLRIDDVSTLKDSLIFSPDGANIVCGSWHSGISPVEAWNKFNGHEISLSSVADLSDATRWLDVNSSRVSPDGLLRVNHGTDITLTPIQRPSLDLAARLRFHWLALNTATLDPPKADDLPPTDPADPNPMLHVRQDTLAQLATHGLTPAKRAELQMQLCVMSGQFRAATAQWQRLLTDSEAAPASDSPIRRLYLIALIDATKRGAVLGHAATFQAAVQIVPVLTKEMMATPTISLAMMSLMQTLAKDDSAGMSAPRAALMKRLEDVATKKWLEVLRESVAAAK